MRFCLIAFLGLLALPANAQDAQEFWRMEGARHSVQAATPHARAGKPMQLTGAKFSGSVPQMIAHATAATIGARHAATMVRIAKIESGLRCSPGGNGGGLFQFTRGTRARLGLHNPLSCSANISAAMRYAASCIRQGAASAGQMMVCWNSGSPHTRVSHLERAYRVALRG